MAIQTIKIPDLGGAESVEVIEIAVAPGDEVAIEDTLLVLESDKATMDVPSPAQGVVKKILVKLGDSVSQGAAIVDIDVADTKADTSIKDSPPDAKADKKDKAENQESTTANEPAAKNKIPSTAPAGGENTRSPVTLPDLGTDESVDVIEISINPGDQVSTGDSLMTLESDKATMEVPSPASGKIIKILIKEGDKVKSGQEVAIIESTVSDDRPQSPKAATDKESAPSTQPETSQPDTSVPTPESEKVDSGSLGRTEEAAAQEQLNEPEAPPSSVYAGPMVRHFARELGVNLANISGTGTKGRIQKEDVEAYVKKALKNLETGAASPTTGGGIPPIPDQDFSQFGSVEEISLSKIDRVTATHMARTWLNVPAVTQFDDADITDMEDFRKSLKGEADKRGVKLTPVAFLMLACARVIRNNPVINRSWHSSGDKIIQKHYMHIGLAVDTPRGLLVPVIRDVDKKGLFDIAVDIAEMAEKARAGKLSATEMQGGCFSITSLGAIGGRGFTPIVNAPEAAILGVSKASIQPVWNGNEFVPRQMLPLSLSYDHKLINGAVAGKFMTELVNALADIRRLML
ncbi:MAG: dihydrolipoyllysine-residue acetyltransferase [Porticoccaceae bacterium]